MILASTARGGRVRKLGTGGLPVLIAMLTCAPPGAEAQTDCRAETPSVHQPAGWEPPLDRVVSISANGEPLRQVLDGLADASAVRLSYSGEVLALDQPVCAVIVDAYLGDALLELIRRPGVEPVTVGPSHVVLAPAGSADVSLSPTPSAVYELDGIVVTNRASGVLYADPFASTVVGGDQLERFGGAGLVHALNVLVPGFWSWSSGSGSVLSGFAGMRGASAFGTASPKIYLDGIEVANPMLLSHVTPETVERVEVIHGPQGSALHGGNSINGVINIVTRRGAGGSGGVGAEVRSSVGIATPGGAGKNRLVHDHVLNLRGGNVLTWGRLTLAGGDSDTSAPDGAGYFSGNAAGGLVRGNAIISGTARIHLEDLGNGAPTRRVGSSYLAPIGPGTGSAEPWRGRPSNSQYTLGATLDLPRNERWTHQIVVGLDGYRLGGRVDTPDTPIAGILSSSPDVGADRATFRASSVVDMPSRAGIGSSIAVTLEQLLSREVTAMDQEVPGGSQPIGDEWSPLEGWRRSSGLAAQADLSFSELVFLTGGLRFEGILDSSPITPLPQVGASIVTYGDLWTLKLRTAYGRAMRARTDPGRSIGTPVTIADHYFDPEMQSGIEAGLTVLIGQAITFDLTRFDQTAFDLVQRTVIMPEVPSPRSSLAEQGQGNRMRNVGEISNRGWEARWTLARGGLSLAGSAATVDSRVARLPGGYLGDLMAGDRMPGVPARMVGIMGSWDNGTWGISSTLSRAWDWIDYDRQRLASDFELPDPAPGTRITSRDYWTSYNGDLGIDASLSFSPISRLGARLSIHNLLDSKVAGPSNEGAHLGRAARLEARLRF